MNDEDEVTFGLVMPFVVAQSQGGPFEDQAYIAGYEMGLLAAELEHSRPHYLRRTLHTANLRQVDLIAMRYGYSLRSQVCPQADWTEVELVRS